MILELTDRGLYCGPGDFYVDPWQPVPRAVVTHAHADHARPGSRRYLIAAPGESVMRLRMGPAATIETVPFGQTVSLSGVAVSFHPAGHILGSAQVRVAYRGEVWVVSGDYKIAADPTCAPFEAVPCDTFITEATFGLPIYRWPEEAKVAAQINTWWRQNQAKGRASVLFAYALGKAQRVLAAVDPLIGPIYVHGAVHKVNQAYRAAGVSLPATTYVGEAAADADWARALIVAPTSAQNSAWLRRFGPQATAFASGWMRVRGQRRRRSVDRGFVLSDHADWLGLLQAIEASGAEQVLVTHGSSAALVRWLREQGRQAAMLQTPFAGEQEDAPVEDDDA
ncbi:MAG: ligase-associated DNA damage response exonuclease [Candidatus Promineifilaceae bacterium]|nr:ligase-associated DNA damage response exonuclease [Candidatus Promineifilaceae bacterium]